MGQNHQQILNLNHRLEVQLPGTGGTAFDAFFGSGTITAAIKSPAGLSAIRLTKNVTPGVVGNLMASHAWPHSFLDPTGSPPPLLFRTESQVECEFTNAARMFFGYGEFLTVADPNTLDGIGFYADLGGNWIAIIVDATGDLLRIDTGVAASAAVHTLSFDIDGGLFRQGVTFNIDGVQVAQLAPLPRALDQISSGAALSLGHQIQGAAASNFWFGSSDIGLLSYVSNESDAGAGFTPCDGCN